jgi:hypothetical protein
MSQESASEQSAALLLLPQRDLSKFTHIITFITHTHINDTIEKIYRVEESHNRQPNITQLVTTLVFFVSGAL